MSTPEDLRDDFAALRDRDRANAPSFDAMLARPAPPRRTSPLVYVLPAAAALAMASAIVLWIGTTALRSAAPPARHAVAVAASDPEPLGFLLDSPPTLARVPDFDSSPIKERR